jgi:hypothetical protein
VFAALLSKMNIPTPTMGPQVFDQWAQRFLVPYDENGK